jgi:tetratricopeptide (TPR) repeat protein
MLLPLLLAAAASAQAVPADMKSCVRMVREDAQSAAVAAAAWRQKGGGLDAQSCEGLALTTQEKWSSAALVFEQAAMEAERSKDLRRADLWVQAGNSWLAGGEAAKARKAFDSALAANLLAPQLRGEVYLDRGRAAVAGSDLAAARTDIDQALALVPADPFAWYLSAALARRTNDLKRAATDIAKAVSIAPNEAAILLEAGNVAGLGGDVEGARRFYQRAAGAAPGTDAGKAAAAALAANGAVTPPR